MSANVVWIVEAQLNGRLADVFLAVSDATHRYALSARCAPTLPGLREV
ncbi:hypothetical protein [Paraburkholderia sartisoli]|nr:hypothetical protein [Paraburkholderia sartisoli]